MSVDSSIDTHPRRLFIIDDDPIQTEMIKDYISDRYIFDLRTFGDGESAMQDIKELEPEIIVLDFHLNSQNATAKDGIEVLKEIMKVSPTTKVFMFSGEDSLDVATKSMANGAYDFIIKGTTAFTKLEHTINRLGDMTEMETIQKAQKKTIAVLSIGIVTVIILALLYLFFGAN
jgi:two-component system, OmpR family, response regulator